MFQSQCAIDWPGQSRQAASLRVPRAVLLEGAPERGVNRGLGLRTCWRRLVRRHVPRRRCRALAAARHLGGHDLGQRERAAHRRCCRRRRLQRRRHGGGDELEEPGGQMGVVVVRGTRRPPQRFLAPLRGFLVIPRRASCVPRRTRRIATAIARGRFDRGCPGRA
jgi:hypothetical protein